MYNQAPASALAFTGVGFVVSWWVATAAAMVFGGIALVGFCRRKNHARP